ncbi:MAG: endo-1,4-beta-xylanase [Candidatus Marinimicrobia bacterium]|nr:endo-1,4-beta-xylanase [Candidatus Neomarinimicrobiota bacterium]MCF7850932.1 endo-1,4-beta-xylanase [Candidatus Neomarinimicrobiota bacterium]
MSIRFKPQIVQKGPGPHLGDKALLLDEQGEVFKGKIQLSEDGFEVQHVGEHKRFSCSVRWNVEGFGYLYMPLDAGGEFYEFDASRHQVFNLNYELARTRIARNHDRIAKLSREHWRPSNKLQEIQSLADNCLEDASKVASDDARCGSHAQKALLYGLKASDLIEIEYAKSAIQVAPQRQDFMFGCDARGYFQMDPNQFLERFTELFDYATITHYLIGDFINFEETEGQKRFSERDRLLDEFLSRGIKVEGRPLYWTHTWVTPEWLKNKSYHQVLDYLEKHVREVVGHYGDRISVWEVVNELHDWANENRLNHEQTIELTRMACEVARDTNPNVQLLINNCCPFAGYVQEGTWHDQPALYPQRTPHQFTQDLVDAGVDFDLLGVQVYYVQRTLAETVAYIEKYAQFGKGIQLAEIGCPSHGITQEFIDPDQKDPTSKPYEWKRHWDEDLQAEWLEAIFSIAYARPYIEAANWYDFVDPHGFLKSGGLLRSPQGENKKAVDKILELRKRWFGKD